MTWLWTNIEDRGSGTIHWTNGAIASFLAANTELREDMWSPSCQCLAQQADQVVSPQGDLGQLCGLCASGSPHRAPGGLPQKLWLWKVMDWRAKLERSICGEKIWWFRKGLFFPKHLIWTWFNLAILVHEPCKKGGVALHGVLDPDSCPRDRDHVSRHISITVHRFLCRQYKARYPQPAQVVKQIPNSLPVPAQGLSSGLTIVSMWGIFQVPFSVNGRRETEKDGKSTLGSPYLYLTIDYIGTDKKCLG